MAEYTEERLQKLLKDLGFSSGISDDEAYDIADSIVYEEEGLKEYLESKGIKDPIGYIANRV